MQGLGAASGPQLWKLLDRTGSWVASLSCFPHTWPTGSPVQGSLLGVLTLCQRCRACPGCQPPSSVVLMSPEL